MGSATETHDDRRERLSVLLLCDNHASQAGTILDHIDALHRYSRHDVEIYNPRGVRRSRALSLDEFDVVVVHYSLMILSDHHLSPDFREKIAQFNGLKMQYVQDDYRQVDQIAERMRELGVDVLFTLVPTREIAAVWTPRLPGVEIRTTLAGYVPREAEALTTMPSASRPLDVGYRGRELPYWVGKLGQEKALIAQGFVERASGTGLTVDIGWREEDRIYGRSWLDFIASSRATLGTESGASITDFDGSLQLRVDAYMAEHPAAGFDEVNEALLAPYEGNVRMNVISPRIFEAIALKTALVLFPGEYSGVVEPERHYIPLEKDFSNFDEVVGRIRDTTGLDELTKRAHREIVQSGLYSYRRMVDEFDDVADGLAVARRRPPRLRYVAARVEHPFGDRLPAGVRRHALVIGSPGEDVRTVKLVAASLAMVARDSQIRDFIRGLIATHAIAPGRAWAVAQDLVRLAVMRRGHAGRLTAGQPFAIQAELLANDRELRFRSVPFEDWQPTDPQAFKLAERLTRGSIQRMTWDHSAVDSSFVLPLTPWSRIRRRVGVSNVPDVHEFRGLLATGTRMPADTARVLEPLVETPIGQLRPPLDAPRVPLILSLTAHPRYYTSLATMILPLVAGRRPLRRLLLVMLRRPDTRRVAITEWAKFALLAKAQRGGVAGVAGVVSVCDGETLRFTTVADTVSGPPSLPDLTGVQHIVWDNSAAGTHIVFSSGDGRPIEIPLGTDGVQEFPLVSNVAQTRPALVREALGGH